MADQDRHIKLIQFENIAAKLLESSRNYLFVRGTSVPRLLIKDYGIAYVQQSSALTIVADITF